MGDVDAEMLLELLEMGQGDVRDMQLMALEQLCMTLLTSDNIDQCFESCPPRTFLPALCNIFMDDGAPENILETTARAMYCYLDVSLECTRRIVAVDGAVKKICERVKIKTDTRTGKDLAEQCIKVLEFMVTREAGVIFQAGGLPSVLDFISENQYKTHKDTLHSAMVVVSKLCTKCEPTDPTLPQCIVTLSDLLFHTDTLVSDGALRCFASLSDRFTRKNIDPAPLGTHGLIQELLERLQAAAPHSYSATPVRSSLGVRPSVTAGNNNTPSEGTISMVISLLSALCRGSESITQTLLGSNISQAFKSALSANERCVLDTMRFIDLLLLLIFEGRNALPKAPQPTTSTSSCHSEGTNHKQLIDCIRSKDLQALTELIESGNYDVNFMDDVGQTLLNWASAFGTLDMVEYLASKGADINKGQRSSSLHYAACFGRPPITKALLKYGANPDLRDEDGKTPLDRAREKNDEGHREVVLILQNPGEWMSNSALASEQQEQQASTSAASEEIEVESETESESKWKRDNEMIVKYLKEWLPLFTNTFHTTLYTSVRKSSLTLLRKIVRYMTPEILHLLCSEDNSPYSAQIVEIIAAVLDVENDENVIPGLMMVRDLCEKAPDIFIDHFCRLGVINNISQRALSYSEEKLKVGKEEQFMIDAVEILPYKPYHWCHWSILHSKECIFLWCDYAAISLSSGSNGWFSFVMDGKHSTIYSAGSLDSNHTESTDSRCEFLEKLQRAKSQVSVEKPSQPILSTPGHRIKIDNWSFYCRREGELAIDNTEGNQSTILRKDLPGFIFESNKRTTHSFNAEYTLGSEISSGWGKKTFKTKSKQLQHQINELSEEINDKFFKDKKSLMRPVVTRMKDILNDIDNVVNSHNEGKPGWREKLKACFTSLAQLLHKDTSLSTFELNTCLLVPCLLRALGNEMKNSNGTVKQQNAINTSLHKSQERIEVFKDAFLSLAKDGEGDDVLLASTLVQKLVYVMESVENLPLYLYESPGAMYGLQVLTKRLRFKLERTAGEHTLLDRTGRNLKIEPLTGVSSVEEYLRRNVAKQWYDYDRSTYKYIRTIKESGSLTFTYGHDFDDNGIIYWIGTNGRTSKDWRNPAHIKTVVISSSDGRSLPYGCLDEVLSRDTAAKNVHTSDDRNGWISVDLALWVVPTKYTLRHARGFSRSALRTWLFQVSRDGKGWVTLRSHVDDTSLNEPGSTATWSLETPPDEKKGWRHFRVHLNGRNSSGNTHYLSISGFELYGTVTGVCDDSPVEIQPLKPIPSLSAERALKRLNRETDSHCRQRLRFYRRPVIKNLSSRSSRGDWRSLQSDTESIKSCSSTGGDMIPGTPDSTEAIGGSETLSVGTISSTPDVTTVDELDDSGTSRQESVTASLNQRNKASDLERFVLELAQQLAMDKNESERNTIHELLGALPQHPRRAGVTESLFSLVNVPVPGHSSSGGSSNNTVEHNNNLNKSTSLELYEYDNYDDDDEEFTDVCEIPIAGNSSSKSEDPSSTCTTETDERSASKSLPATTTSTEFQTPETSELCSSSAFEESGMLSTQRTTTTTTTSSSKQPSSSSISRKEEVEEEEEEEDESDGTPSEDSVSRASNVDTSDEVIPLMLLPDGNSSSKLPAFSEERPSGSRSSSHEVTASTAIGTAPKHTPPVPRRAAVIHKTRNVSEILSSDMFGGESQMKRLLDTMGRRSVDIESIQPRIEISDNLSEGTYDSQESDLPSSIEPYIDLSSYFEAANPTATQKPPVQSTPPGASHHTSEESPSTPTNDLSQVVPPSSSNPPLQENIPGDVKQESSAWEKSVYSAGSKARGVEYLPFDELEQDEIGDDDDDDEDEDEDDEDDDDYDPMGFDMESDDDSHKPIRLTSKLSTRNRVWDDEVVLKRQFSALIPAFDPRPGRSNVAQTTDIEVTAPGARNIEASAAATNKKQKPGQTGKGQLALFIRLPALPGSKPEEYLCPPKKTIFSCIVSMNSSINRGYLPTPTVRRLWEPNYTLLYREMRPSDNLRLAAQDLNPFEVAVLKPRWDMDYINKYLGTEKLSKMDLINYLQATADSIWLKKWRLNGPPRSMKKSKASSYLKNAYREFLANFNLHSQKQVEVDNSWYKNFSQCLVLLSIIHNALIKDFKVTAENKELALEPEVFHSGRLTTRLMQQVQEPLFLTTHSLPFWCNRIVHSFPMLIPYETRSLYFNATAFGISRSINWLQNMRDNTEQRPRNVAVRRQEDMGEFRVGRMKHERCTIPRGEDFLDWAFNVLQHHANNKSVLEIEFKGEEGTGIGPTLEFYSLVAAELQRKDLGLWICDDENDVSTESMDLGQGPKPPGYYVNPSNGLFPAPYPQDSPKLERICSIYRMLGIFLGKSFLDQRLVDLPLSIPFFKLMCSDAEISSSYLLEDVLDSDDPSLDHVLVKSSSLSSLAESEYRYRCDSDAASDRSSAQGSISVDSITEHDSIKKSALIEDVSHDASMVDTSSECSLISKSSWFAGVLNSEDFTTINPYLAKFLDTLEHLAEKKRQVLCDPTLNESQKSDKLDELILPNDTNQAKLDDLYLDFQYNPSSKVYGYMSYDLKPNGGDIPLSIRNIEEYIDLTRSFCLDVGIRKQMESFRAGFNEVFPMSNLRMFSPTEVMVLLCGEMTPSWTKEDLLNYTEPKFGYNKDSPGFVNLVDILVEMDGQQRKNFLQFATGCSSLPPGGIANLHPRLTVVKKEADGDNALPSVNTCVHYLKLPDYSSKEIMRSKLLQSTEEKGFHLN